MKIFVNTKFTSLRKENGLISIGLVDENGDYFYGEVIGYSKQYLDDWTQTNIVDKLLYKGNKFLVEEEINGISYVAISDTKKNVRKKLNAWLDKYDKVEWVLDVGYYPFVNLLDLIAPYAINIPSKYGKTYIELNELIAKDNNVGLDQAFDVDRYDYIKDSNMLLPNCKLNALMNAHLIRVIYYKLAENKDVEVKL